MRDMRDMKCIHCPVDADRRCPGEDAPSLCGRPEMHAAILSSADQLHARAYPSPAQQAANLAAAFWGWATSGFRMASEEEVTRRQSICRACPRWDAAAARCPLCGCYTQAKTRLKAEHCPEGRW
jgi:hypothetical protein